MSQASYCSKCGNPIRPDAQFCPYCGNPLTPSAPPQPTSPQAQAPPTGSFPYTPPPYIGHESWNFEMAKWIDRTKNGLLLLLIGIVIAVIPLIGFIGTIIAAIGVIFVILGRRAFGDKHSKYVLYSVGVYIFGFIVLFFVALIFAFSIASALSSATSSSQLLPTLSSALNTFVIGLIIGGATSGLSYVLLTYAIQNQTGRILLWVAYGVSLALEAILFVIITPQISSALNASIVNGGFDPTPINALRGQISSLGFLNIIPYGIYAAAYYLVYSRVNRGELPPRATTQPLPPPSTPPTM